jgi:5'-3' exonuclease
VGATRTLVRSLAAWLRTGEVTHAAYAFDHVIESFRNRLFTGYKTSEGIDPELYGQFELAERAVAALGMVVWPMIEFEADDALATGAKRFAAVKGVRQVLLCSPDKDLAQCVRGRKIVGFDRWKKTVLDEKGVKEKFGVPPKSIPDLLALVGDTADGIPGLPRWGMKSAATVLAAYVSLERIPDDGAAWKPVVRGAPALAQSLAQGRKEALLYRRLATVRYDVPLKESVRDLEWRGGNRREMEWLGGELGVDLNLPWARASG